MFTKFKLMHKKKKYTDKSEIYFFTNSLGGHISHYSLCCFQRDRNLDIVLAEEFNLIITAIFSVCYCTPL